MRKLSLLTVAVVACSLTAAASASAADRYAVPGGNATNIATCGPLENCDLESAMNTTYLTDGSSVRVAAGVYNVTTPLSVIAAGAGIVGSGETSADVVINSTVTGSPALTIDNDSEAEKFTLNTVTSASTSGGLRVIDGIATRIVVTATGQYANACTGENARFVNVVCRATGDFGSAFRVFSSTSLALDFISSTLHPGPYGYGYGSTAIGASTESIISMFSTIIVEGSGHPLMLGTQSGAPEPEFEAEYSNYPGTQRVIDGGGQSYIAPVGATNQAAAPIFTDAASGDLTQAPDSPTINAGSTTGLTGSTDVAGNARVQGASVDIGAYEHTPPVVVTPPVTTPPAASAPILDLLAPKLTITKKPKSKTTSKKLRVTFKANETATYLCKLDKSKFRTCKSPYKKTVKLGKHKLQIKATDAAGNVSAVKTIKWTVKAP